MLPTTPLHHLLLRKFGGTLVLGVIRQAMARGINAPMSGRLFEAVTAALDLAPERLSFEGQAAMTLEALASTSPDTRCYPFILRTETIPRIIDPAPMWKALLPSTRMVW